MSIGLIMISSPNKIRVLDDILHNVKVIYKIDFQTL